MGEQLRDRGLRDLLVQAPHEAPDRVVESQSILLAPGGSFQRYEPFIPSDAIIGTCASNSDTLYIDTQ